MPNQSPALQKLPGQPFPWFDVAGYLATVSVVCFYLVVSLQLWRADLTIPLIDGNDSLYAQMCVLNVIESGWYHDGLRSGAPDVQNLRDYPMPDVLHYSVVKLLTIFSSDPFVVYNLFNLSNFPLIALAAYFALRQFGAGRSESVVASTLYAFAPYHFIRLGHHWLLCAFYLVPLMIWLILRVYTGWDPLLRTSPAEGDRPPRLLSWEVAGVVLLCILTGLAGIYYAFFCCFLLVATGIRVAARERRWSCLMTPALLILLVSATSLAAVVPAIVHLAREGRNPSVANRSAIEAEIHGLKVTEMLMPAFYHRLEAMRAFRASWFEPQRPATASQIMPPLGILASLGLLFLLGRFLWWRAVGREQVADGLAYLTVMTVALTSVGGFAALFAYFVTPLIRCYDRMSIFIAFFATAALFLGLSQTVGRAVRGPCARTGYAIFLVLLLLVGIYDQTPPNAVPYEKIAKEFASHHEFAHRLEAMLPAGAMVHQLPYMSFPECVTTHELGGYELLRPLLHTHTLRFSFGAIQGRSTDQFFARLASVPLPDRVDTLVALGFAGIYLDRRGYADKQFETELASLLEVTPITSEDERLAFYPLSTRAAKLQSQHSRDALRRHYARLLEHRGLSWGIGCHVEETDKAGLRWRWCNSSGVITIVNDTPQSIRKTLRFGAQTYDTNGGDLSFSSPLFEDRISLSRTEVKYTRVIDVPPGSHRIAFACTAKPYRHPSRTLVFKFADFELTESPDTESRVRLP